MPIAAERTPLTLSPPIAWLTGVADTRSPRYLLSTVSGAARKIPMRIGERRGEPSAPRPPVPLIWVHGASVGEFTAVLPLVERIRARGILPCSSPPAP